MSHKFHARRCLVSQLDSDRGGVEAVVLPGDQLVRPEGDLISLLVRLPPQTPRLVEEGDVLVLGGGDHLGLVGLRHHVLAGVYLPGVHPVSDGLQQRLEGG